MGPTVAQFHDGIDALLGLVAVAQDSARAGRWEDARRNLAAVGLGADVILGYMDAEPEVFGPAPTGDELVNLAPWLGTLGARDAR